MGRSTDKETRLSEQRKYRSWTAQQKIEIVLGGLRGDRSVKEVCREHEISDTLYYSWREKLLEGGREALAGKEERGGERELRRRIRELERAQADPALPPARAAQAAGLLPGRAAAAALAARPHLGLGRRARLVQPDGDDRLLHPRDRRLAARAALPSGRGDHARRASGRRARDRRRRAHARLGQRLGLHRSSLPRETKRLFR